MIAKPKPYEKAVFLGRSASTAMQQAWLDLPSGCDSMSRARRRHTLTLQYSDNTTRKIASGFAIRRCSRYARSGGMSNCDACRGLRQNPSNAARQMKARVRAHYIPSNAHTL